MTPLHDLWGHFLDLHYGSPLGLNNGAWYKLNEKLYKKLVAETLLFEVRGEIYEER